MVISRLKLDSFQLLKVPSGSSKLPMVFWTMGSSRLLCEPCWIKNPFEKPWKLKIAKIHVRDTAKLKNIRNLVKNNMFQTLQKVSSLFVRPCWRIFLGTGKTLQHYYMPAYYAKICRKYARTFQTKYARLWDICIICNFKTCTGKYIQLYAIVCSIKYSSNVKDMQIKCNMHAIKAVDSGEYQNMSNKCMHICKIANIHA